ncbi:26S proteasome regulatory subunit N11 [Babesia microti strain RI]|uniref:26S proteasome regulatory subunit N11 n=1 Tax=Babesia microti (strain RI) TaxID=1133968 RepID=A0A1R4ABN9_BABMR|nr:26S proteasome regulatory subunit N11 [Babesia microti strain RI]SJK86416.1 26S proteasome regulatory subunit N11 [Babesia microti strain RI]|eukprot:XP_021338577.1 26S proteasome regulatory subunit N11 [Babesia microti strain RI]
MAQSFRDIFNSFSGMASAQSSGPVEDTSERVEVSSLALLKMLKHGRAGVPMEVMGLMLGEFVDNYTIRVVDVFSMPQSGNSVSVEAVDPVYQTVMLDQLKRTGRPEMVVGWYHSHPGFGCWFSGTDVNTQQSFEQLNPRAVGIVVDPIQSVKGKVVIDCFRLINPHLMMLGHEPRQTTSNIGHLQKPTITALVHGLNRNYYSIVIKYRRTQLETDMMIKFHQFKWTNELKIQNLSEFSKENDQGIEELSQLIEKYKNEILEEAKMSPEELQLSQVGKIDVKNRLENCVTSLLNNNILHSISLMLPTQYIQ